MDALLAVTRGSYGDSGFDITLAAILAVLAVAAVVWVMVSSWTTTHHHRPH
jgi:hypothetical protein